MIVLAAGAIAVAAMTLAKVALDVHRNGCDR